MHILIDAQEARTDGVKQDAIFPNNFTSFLLKTTSTYCSCFEAVIVSYTYCIIASFMV